MRILFINHVGFLGGGEKSMLTLIEGLRDDKGHIIELLAPPGELSIKAEDLGIKVHNYDFESIRRSWNPIVWLKGLAGFWKGIKIIDAIITAGKFSAVHANSLKSAIMGGLAARRTGIPLIFHTRDYLNAGLFGRWLVAWAYRLSFRIIANSGSVAGIYGPGAKGKISVVYNAIELPQTGDVWQKTAIKQENGLDPSVPVIGFVGRLHPDKGIETLLKAFKVISQSSLKDVRLWLVGGPMSGEEWYLDKLKLIVDRSGIAKRVTFFGWRKDALKLMSGMDILVVPSKKEPFGRVTVEAMLKRVPVVATSSGGTLEIIDDHKTGLLFLPGDHQALVRCVLEILKDKVLCDRITAEARLEALRKFSYEQYINGVQRVYDSMAWK